MLHCYIFKHVYNVFDCILFSLPFIVFFFFLLLLVPLFLMTGMCTPLCFHVLLFLSSSVNQWISLELLIGAWGRALYRNMGNWPVLTRLKKESLFYYLLVVVGPASQRGAGPHEPHPILWQDVPVLILCVSCIGYHRCREFKRIMTIHAQKTAFHTLYPFLWLLCSFLPLFCNVP